MTENNTPLPWKAAGEEILTEDNVLIARMECDLETDNPEDGYIPESQGRANAALVVRAVNNQEPMLRALLAALSYLMPPMPGIPQPSQAELCDLVAGAIRNATQEPQP